MFYQLLKAKGIEQQINNCRSFAYKLMFICELYVVKISKSVQLYSDDLERTNSARFSNIND